MIIARKSKSDEELAFEILFREYYVRLCGFANKFISSSTESEEIVQEVFLNIWKKRGQYKLNDDIRPYLFKSVQNLCFNFLEHKKLTDKYYSIIEIVYKDHTEDYNTYESVLYTEFENKASAAINSLPVQCRKIFQMSREDGLKYSEIAEKLGISVKTVETQMSRALSKLRTELNDYLTAVIITLLMS